MGRSPGCNVRLEEAYASGEHARVTWMGTAWEIRDLGSRNGTFVDGQRLKPGEPVALEVGATVGFGDSNGGWRVIDVEGPRLMAVDQESQAPRIAEGDYLVLPTEEAPRVSVHPSKDGVGWVMEDADGDTTPVDDGQVIVVEGKSFKLELPAAAEETPMYAVARTLSNLSLRLAVSRDEETVVATAIFHGIESDLEAREHSYLLLTLARAYAEDEANDVALSDRGWRKVDDLCDMLKVGRNMIDVMIHRARQQFAKAGIEGSAGIVESRRGQRRFGVPRFEITEL
ncbi:MAG: FHA domain-containing protein [Deltaproteobacteria bacterium]